MKKFLGILTLLTLFSCGGGQNEATQKVDASAFPVQYISKDKAIQGGELRKAMVQDSPFVGIFSLSFQTEATDYQLTLPILGTLFYTDDDFLYKDGGAMTMRYDTDKNIVHLKLRKGMKWEDGVPVTMDDYIFVYKILASPKYKGPYYTDDMQNVVGIDDYHNGKTKEISGLQKINDYELDIHLKKVSPFVSALGGGIASYLEPYHYLKDIPIDKLQQSPKIRLHPLSWGPYKISKIVPGESIEYVPNENYYDKEHMPKVSKMIFKVLPTTSVIASMKNGEYDVYEQAPQSSYSDYKGLKNQVVLGQPALAYYYIGFNLGHWDDKNNVNVTDPNAKLANIELRKAIGYALNLDEISKDFYNGLRIRANAYVPPIFKLYYDKTLGYNYNPEKAKEILDKLGYKDVNGDGYREDPNGKPFVITFAFPAGGDIAEPLAQSFIQNWQAVGLNVKLATGRLINGAAYWPMIQSNKGYDMFIGGWSLGSTMDPSGIYTSKANYNLPRLSNSENDKLIADISSEKAAKDPKYKVAAYIKWEKYYLNNILGFFPTFFKYDTLPINKRVKEYTLTNDSAEAAKFVDAVTRTTPFTD